MLGYCNFFIIFVKDMNITIKNTNSELRESFWTDANKEDILWCIKIHEDRLDLIRKWDIQKINSSIGWVSYHLRRAGFKVHPKKKDKMTYVKCVKELCIMKS